MKLSAVARYFDREKVYDAYTGLLLFKGQMLSPAEHVSGDTFRRHTLSTADGMVAPARGAVTIMGDVWLIGNNNPDGHNYTVMRRNFTLKKSTGLMNLLTPAQACLSATGTPIHSYKEYYRDSQNIPTEADLDTFWNIYCPQNEAVSKGSFFRQNGTIFRVRNVYNLPEGFNVAETDQFDADALQTITVTTNGELNLVTDTIPTVTVTTGAVQTDIYKFYRFSTEAEDKQKPGDRTVFIPKSAITPKILSTLTMLSKTWRVLAVVSEQDSWALHVRMT